MTELQEWENFDWKKLKDFLCNFVKDLENICKIMPDGTIKNLLCGIIGLLQLICNLIPG